MGPGCTRRWTGSTRLSTSSNAFPAVDSLDLHDALASATRNVVTACSSQRVGHLVFLSIWGVENPVFDGFPY